MLDEDEFKQLLQVLNENRQRIKLERQNTGKTLQQVSIQAHFQPTLDFYEQLTGERETNPNALWHHRISLYGPPCPGCGVPLRTPEATWCPKCGWSKE